MAMIVMLGLAGGAYANDTLKTLTEQAQAATASNSNVPSPVKAALGAAEENMAVKNNSSVVQTAASYGGQVMLNNDAVDNELVSCLNTMDGSAPTPTLQQTCLGFSYERKDKKLNDLYVKLMISLKSSPEQHNALRDAQRKWMAYRDAEFALMEIKNSSPETAGSADVVELMKAQIAVIDAQIKLLNVYLNESGTK